MQQCQLSLATGMSTQAMNRHNAILLIFAVRPVKFIKVLFSNKPNRFSRLGDLFYAMYFSL